MSPCPVAIVLAAVLALGPVLIEPSTARANSACAEPGAAPQRRAAEEVGMDEAALAAAMDFGIGAKAHAIQVYRHGCLIADHAPTGDLPMPLFSASKGVTAVAVGRAVTLGHFGLDDPIGRFFPTADAAHARITVRQVLTQTTGLHFSWPADVASIATSTVDRVLAAPIDYEPGTTFQYAQAVLGLLPRIIEITTGLDYQEFVRRELMGPLGIPRDHWVWLRDRDTTTAVAGGLAMRPADLARIARLVLQRGEWAGNQLIDADYLRQATTPTQANGGYGFLLWLNAGETFRGVNVPVPALYEHRLFPGLPHDTIAFSGALGQLAVVIPSRDLVIIRLGVPATIDPNNLTGFLTGTSNPDNRMLFHRIVAAVENQEPLEDPDLPPDPIHRTGATPEERALLLDPHTTAAILLGTGAYGGCDIAVCHGRPLPADIFGLALDVGNQLAAALPGER
ncbi:serine hydrolase domain-containing protein [Nocardia caishijiensis]|uniref:CubicO group peptidase (Beta-lactamase class C family) n=1 Tax=Nocardia caishijiensis TaxID=184756 RepID=A0ABQ6YI30_9NOCA|nr:serine hydrolase [Nocardia caishijiensis]KAF0845430.1 CubicO group peptidase (beta-lactamase class C family) [Nocardia caishijiensis]